MSGAAIGSEPIAPAGVWAIDPVHSNVEFGVEHLGFATVRGRVGKFSGTLVGGEHPRLEGALSIGTLTTYDEQRDGHLRTPDFFDVERYPGARFVSTSIVRDGDSLLVRAELTLRGVTRPVTLRGSVTGVVEDPWGHERIGLRLEGSIDRTRFGIAWSELLPGGGLLVSKDVELAASFSLVKEA